MTTDPRRTTDLADAFGRRVAARLSAGTHELPYEVSERLRAARSRALALRKMEAAPTVVGRGASATLALEGEKLGWWSRVAAVVPLLALAAGLVLIQQVQGDDRANELAEVDAALLTDDLPPAAYADPGFVQFLQQSSRE